MSLFVHINRNGKRPEIKRIGEKRTVQDGAFAYILWTHDENAGSASDSVARIFFSSHWLRNFHSHPDCFFPPASSFLPSTLNRSPHAKPSSSSSIAIQSWKSLNVKALTRTQVHYKINERNVEQNWNMDRKSKDPTLSLDWRKKKKALPRLTVSRRRRKAQKMELRRRHAWWCATRYRFRCCEAKQAPGSKPETGRVWIAPTEPHLDDDDEIRVRIRARKASHQRESFLSLHFFAVALGIGSISFLSFFSFGSCCLQIVCCAGDIAVVWLAVCRGAWELEFRWHACIPRLALGDRYSFTVASGHRLTCWWGL